MLWEKTKSNPNTKISTKRTQRMNRGQGEILIKDEQVLTEAGTALPFYFSIPQKKNMLSFSFTSSEFWVPTTP
jgi:hypothetical protein